MRKNHPTQSRLSLRLNKLMQEQGRFFFYSKISYLQTMLCRIVVEIVHVRIVYTQSAPSDTRTGKRSEQSSWKLLHNHRNQKITCRESE